MEKVVRGMEDGKRLEKMIEGRESGEGYGRWRQKHVET